MNINNITNRPPINKQDADNFIFQDSKIEKRYLEKMLSKIQKGNQKADCWIWSGSINSKGTPIMGIGKHLNPSGNLVNRVVGVQKLVYTYYYGDINQSYRIKRFCKNERCVNPYHLYAEIGA